MAHSSGFEGTSRRTTVAAVNTGRAAAQVQAVFRSATVEETRTATLAAGAAHAWSDVLVELFGIDPGANLSGSLIGAWPNDVDDVSDRRRAGRRWHPL